MTHVLNADVQELERQSRDEDIQIYHLIPAIIGKIRSCYCCTLQHSCILKQGPKECTLAFEIELYGGRFPVGVGVQEILCQDILKKLFIVCITAVMSGLKITTIASMISNVLHCHGQPISDLPNHCSTFVLSEHLDENWSSHVEMMTGSAQISTDHSRSAQITLSQPQFPGSSLF